MTGKIEMNIWKALVGVMLLVAAQTVSAADPADRPLEGASPCVAYRTFKDTLFAKVVEVLGRNCHVATKVEQDPAGGRFRVHVTVPVDGFESGNSRRDRHVAGILGKGENAPVVFTSGWFHADIAAAFKSGKPGDMKGELPIGGQTHPVTLRVTAVAVASQTVMRAWLVTTFAQLGVAVEPVGPGGMIARPKPGVELLGQILLPEDAAASLPVRHG